MSSRFMLRRQAGVTMVELVLFIVIVGIALAGIVTVMNLTTKNSVDPMRRKQALIIAEGLLEEIELARFSYCDPASDNADTANSVGECKVPEAFGRSAPEQQTARPYDNVNDYVAAPGVAVAAFDANGVLTAANGNAIPVNGYSARVTITPATLGPVGGQIGPAASPANAADTEVLRITVQVSYDSESVVLDGYRTRYAPNSL